MVVKIYVSGISGNKEVKKRQQRVLMILDSKNVAYEVIDITEPGKEDEKEFMQTMSTATDSKYPLPPQIFNEDDYCGDYEGFDLANENDELEQFLKLSISISTAEVTLNSKSQNKEVHQNGNTSSREPSTEKDDATAITESMEERRTSVVNEERASGNSERRDSESEVKDISDEDIEHVEEVGETKEDTTEDQEREE
ncbi:SH3 domain-binding glutamic acid-rich protein homolog [Leptopilina boulardi]|uniref:SH3 domain-binding glutamic acid-rich protein homolog n=1 Tax=Leptopilina boulardi TaxID=63433 RepID=UPI0021F69B2B|nr:SH3 domain-binding glutamic acid-rich protein homolog [Leptopilina boulardi]